MNTEKPFEIFRYKDSLSEYLYGYCGLSDPESAEQDLDDMVNYRGLHNAKPRIKLGLAQKYLKNRNRIYRIYRREGRSRAISIDKSQLGFNLVMSSIKSMAESPAYLCFPRCYMESSIAADMGGTNKLVVYKKGDIPVSRGTPDIRKSVAATIDSIRTGTWYYGSDPFVFYDFWRRRKSGYLLSEKNLPRLTANRYNLPLDFRVFCPNAKLFATEFAYRTGRIPISWKENLNLCPEYKMYLFKDTFEMILPTDLQGGWRYIKHLYKKDLYQLRNILSSINLRDRTAFKAFLVAAELLFISSQEIAQEPLNAVDEDILDILDRYEEEELYSHIISEVYTAEDLLSDIEVYEEAYSFDSEEEYEFEEFETFEPDDDETEDSDPGFNEIRRLARQGENPGIG